MSVARIPGLGAVIDRRQPVSFSFDGRRLSGYAGDTLASALLANSISIVGRSFKLHRPRGVMGSGIEECNAFVRIIAPYEEPNALATFVPLVEGLEARSVHAWPRAGFDVMAGLQGFARWLPAGFYYKTFIGYGGNAWPYFEPMIRKLAGLGHAPDAPDPLPSETRYDHIDILIVGAGPAGIAAAKAVVEGGASALLVDDSTNSHPDLAAELRQLAKIRNLRILQNAGALGIHHDRLVSVHERRPKEPFLRDRLWKVRASCIILATGSVEQPLVIAGNDRPGVMLAGSALHYRDFYGVSVGQRIAVVTNNAEGVQVAARLCADGAPPVAVAIVGEMSSTLDLPADIIHCPQALSIHGGRRVRRLCMRDASGRAMSVSCDTVLISGGFQPTVQLWTQAGGRLEWSEAAQALLPVGAADGVIICGAAAGATDPPLAAISGKRAGLHALAVLSGAATQPADAFGGPGVTCWGDVSVPALRDSEPAFVDLHNDVTRDDVALAQREGYRIVDHIKRYTTLGMGIDQGRTSARNGARLARPDAAPAQIRTTTMRPPWRPVPFAAIAGVQAGPLASPWRTTPLTAWAKSQGAVFYESGADWRRPGYFPRAGENLVQAARREANAVRQGVGIYDSSPLGKIVVRGPDSVPFLDFIYAGRIATMKPQSARYGLMLREDGRIFDDGVVFRESDNQFIVTTTSGNASAVLSWLEFVKAAHAPQLDVRFLDIGEQWADVCLCGPLARQLLCQLCDDVDLSPQAFPFMAMREGTVVGRSARIMRVSFTGELSYEIWLPRREASALWDAAIEIGASMGLTPIGSEANHILRVEKGYLSIGHEVDGFANPFDLGLHRFIAMAKEDFIGKRALIRDLADHLPRPELVGLLTEDRGVLSEGAPIVTDASLSPGFVTAAVDSPALGRGVALALLDGGRASMGAAIDVMDGVRRRRCIVTAPIFVDPDGERLRS